MQSTFDELYERSKDNAMVGVDLYNKVVSRENILLAYRSIKGNTGSKTAGTDKKTIKDFVVESDDYLVKYVRDYLREYKPGTVRREMIPKGYGKGKRPLGIPTMLDRLVQQMFKQIIDPIVEAKFYAHSYGFRPNRGTKHAVSRCQTLVNIVGLHYVVDIDIKEFFDNINHNKLMKQLYTIGVKDKRVLKIIARMLKAPISGEGIPLKGTPQGGILSPLLSNVVLNDLDQWVCNQWETFETDYKYSLNGHKVRELKKTNLKEMYIVRYADDFKIFARTFESANRIYHAVAKYLKDNLGLDISEEKSKVANLKNGTTDFLGFKLKTKVKGKKRVMISYMSESKKKEVLYQAKNYIKEIQKRQNPKTINKYNDYVMSLKNYYKVATHAYVDFSDIAYRLSKALHNRFKSIGKYGIPISPTETYKHYNRGKFKTYIINGIPLHPWADIQTDYNRNFSQDICNYTDSGRAKYRNLNFDIVKEMRLMLLSADNKQTVEYVDNRLSKYSMQKGLCNVLGVFLFSDDVECHHIKPKSMGGNDTFKNLVIIDKRVHKLIHATKEETIGRYLNELNLNNKQIEKVNKYRKSCNLLSI